MNIIIHLWLNIAMLRNMSIKICNFLLYYCFALKFMN